LERDLQKDESKRVRKGRGMQVSEKIHRRAAKYAEEAQREEKVRDVLSLNRNRIGKISRIKKSIS
jgi:hypothetical protein